MFFSKSRSVTFLKVSKPLIFLLSVGIVFFACAPMDVDNIQPFQYIIKDFDGKITLGIANKKKPALTDFEPGGIELPPATLELVEDILTAILRDNLKDENENILQDFAFLRDPVAMDNRLKDIDVNDIDNILDTTIPLEDIFADIFFLVEDVPGLFRYLPTYIPPKIDGIIFNFYDIPPKVKGRIIPVLLNDYDPSKLVAVNSSLVTPCAVAVDAAYNVALGNLILESERQIAEAGIFYDGIRVEIADIKNDRFDYLSDTLQGSIDELRRLGIAINIASENLLREGKINEEIYYGIKLFMVAFLVKSRQNLIMFNDTVIAAIEKIADEDIERVNQAYNDFLDDLEDLFGEAMQDLNGIRNSALNNCHNQGGGS
ncbi:hypothetical protein MM213_01005 [Belliella sp. R4-6]|uniref:Lipoprotein n=1 Tax=Belliella alkalica TaxID=1730871 RepID=A0ABS9V7V7_9BACT|nr:hypothetical protein [Belliella alkalica]MCH7412045.1 hypothetical protein [Belliella alkalica]